MTRRKPRTGTVLALVGSACALAYASSGVHAQTAPRFHYDPTWPDPLPNLWKLGGVTGLAVDSNDNVWVYNRPNDAQPVERRAVSPGEKRLDLPELITRQVRRACGWEDPILLKRTGMRQT